MKTFDIEFSFLIAAHTRGYTIKANDKADALRIARDCIDKHGMLDFEKFAAAGGTVGSWDNESSTDHGYEIDADGVTSSDDESEEEDAENTH